MSDENEFDAEAWINKILADSTMNVAKAEANIHTKLRRLSIYDITQMVSEATDYRFDDFDNAFIEACLCIPMGLELKRRMQALRNGQMTIDEVVTPPAIDPADGWDDQEPPAS